MKRLLLVALTAGLVAQPLAVSAQLAPVPGASEYLKFVGAGSAVVASWGGVMVGPYQGQFTTSSGTPTSGLFSLYCVDYTHYAGSQKVNATNLYASPLSLGNTRLGSFAKYQQTAYLSSLFDSWQTLGYGTNQRTVWSGIHAAIWSVSNGVTLGGGTSTVGSAGWIRNQLLKNQTHVTNAQAFNTNGWYVISPASGYNGQEFLIRTPPVSVPEPGTLLLMLTGIVVFAVASRRRQSLLA